MDDSIKSFMEEVRDGESNVLNVVEKLSDGTISKNRELSLSRRLVMPDRMESPPRQHEFYSVTGFVEYLKKVKTAGSLVMGDVTNGNIVAILDESEKRGIEILTLKPQPHPEYELLYTMLNRRMEISKFAELAMRNRRALGKDEDDGRDFAMLMQQITISSKVTACIGSGKKAVNGLMCTTEVVSGTSGTALVEIPDTVKASVPLYVERPVREFTLDLTVVADQESALITADATELKVLAYHEIQMMVGEVKERLNGEIQTCVGRVSHGKWVYNK